MALNVVAIKLHFIVRFYLHGGECDCVSARVTNISFLNYAIFIEISSLVYCHARMFSLTSPLHLTLSVFWTSVLAVGTLGHFQPTTYNQQYNNTTWHLGPTPCPCTRNHWLDILMLLCCGRSSLIY